MQKLTLLGKPVSVNSLYQGRRFLTQRGKTTKDDYAYQIKRQYKGEILDGELVVNITVYFTSKKSSDLDNVLKATFDSLTGLLWKDDRQIVEIHAYKEQDKIRPRIELEIRSKSCCTAA